jgi:PST family polysaccharide transporter
MSEVSAQQEQPPAPAPASLSTQSLVLKNALFLVLAQAVTIPISVFVNAMMGRYLGAEDFGVIYLVTTFGAFATIFIEWGGNGTLPAEVARDRSRAGELLGSALVFRLLAAPLVYLVLAGVCHALGYSSRVQMALAVVMVGLLVAAAMTACQDTVRGFERTDIAALGQAGNQILVAILVVSGLLLGGRMFAVLALTALASTVVLTFVARALKPVGIGTLRVRRESLRALFRDGWPFLVFGLTMALQPNIDAIFLSKLAPAEAVGWHAAARKLVGVLVYPASAVISALYPTLCRLYAGDHDAFHETTRSALRASATLVMPIAVGTFLYADLAVSIFSEAAFGPAAWNLRALSLFILLVYFSMPLGACLLAAGRQRAWTVVQLLCVVFSVVLDPLLVPFFQERMGNGGIGICVATAVSELFMVAGGIWLTPRGLFNRALLKSLTLMLIAAGAMFGVGWLLRSLTPFVAAPIAVVAYAGVLWAIGGVDKQQVQMVKDVIARKTRRRSA